MGNTLLYTHTHTHTHTHVHTLKQTHRNSSKEEGREPELFLLIGQGMGGPSIFSH
jgi:hypothetical protein